MKQRETLLAEEPIKKLFWRMSTPAMIGMIVVALYNIIDTIFVGHGVGALGIAGTAIFFPVYMIVMSIGQVFGLGGTSIISRKIGERKKSDAELVMGNVISLIFISSVLITIVGMIFLEPLLNIFGATSAILPHAIEYGRVIFAGSIFIGFAVSFNNLIRAEGDAKRAMISIFIGIVVNTILDWVFIFPLNMGMAGAAWATIIGYMCSTIYIFYYFSYKSLLKIQYKNLKLKLSVVKEIAGIGFSGFIRQASGSMAAMIINRSLGFYGGDVSIAVFGIINRLMGFVVMPMFGIVQGSQPIIGYNYGAGDDGRVIETIKFSVLVTSVISIATWALILVFPTQILSIFTKDAELIALATPALKIVFMFSFLIGFQIVSGGMYQAMGRIKVAMFLSALRRLIMLIPLVLILPRFFGLEGLWYAFAVADIFSAGVTYFFYKRELRLIAKHLEVVKK